MGRRSIPIERIEDSKRRMSTLRKRSVGLVKKAAELARLSGSQVVVVINDRVKPCERFASDDINSIFRKYRQVTSGVARTTTTATATSKVNDSSGSGVVENGSPVSTAASFSAADLVNLGTLPALVRPEDFADHAFKHGALLDWSLSPVLSSAPASPDDPSPFASGMMSLTDLDAHYLTSTAFDLPPACTRPSLDFFAGLDYDAAEALL